MKHQIVSTHPDGYVSGHNPPGIGNVLSYGSLLAICNLDRNFEVTAWKGNSLKPLARYEFTGFPPGEENAPFDLDFHGFLPDARGNLFALNHFGHLRRFPRFADIERAECALLWPEQENVWLGDVERTVLVQDRLISSSPGGYNSADSQQPGLFISSNVYNGLDDEGKDLPAHSRTDLFGDRKRLAYTCHFGEWGHISALAFDGNSRLAFAAGTRVGLLELGVPEQGRIWPMELIWEQRVDFHAKLFSFSGACLLVSGYRPTSLGEGDFSHLRGGGLAKLRLSDGELVAGAALAVDLAWGNGATPLVFAPAREMLFGVDRQANLYAFDARTLELRRVFERPASEIPAVLGAGHMAAARQRIYCGFNRGGYQLHVYSFAEEDDR
jgi:hypothetical protein